MDFRTQLTAVWSLGWGRFGSPADLA